MRTKLQILTTVALFTLSTVPASAAIYMKVDGIKGRVTAAGREKWIELDSIQFMTPGTAKGTIGQPLGQLCESRAAMPSVAFEIDGNTHTLRNVQFSDCRTTGNATNLNITFSGCATHPSAPDHLLGGGSAPAPRDHKIGGGSYVTNATLTGLTPGKVNARLLSVKVRGNKATVVVAVPPASLPSTREASSPAVSEIVVTKINDAASWSFTGAHVLYQDITIPAAARNESRLVELTIDFQSMKGSRADYADPENPLAGR